MATSNTSGVIKRPKQANSNRGIQTPTGKGNTKAFQFKNALTGHFITQNNEGIWVVKTDGKPFEGVEIKRMVLAAPNPAIDPETAQLGEEAALEYFNSKKR